jgi:rhodanese-related sulfurtransferase
MQDYLDFAIRHWELFALLGLVLALIIGNEIFRKIRGSTGLSVNETLRAHNDEDAILLDVREVTQYRDGHIPGAKNTPLSALKEKLSELKLPKDRPVIFYCETGSRSGGASSQLRKQGHERAYSLIGGFNAWQQASLPVAKGRK